MKTPRGKRTRGKRHRNVDPCVTYAQRNDVRDDISTSNNSDRLNMAAVCFSVWLLATAQLVRVLATTPPACGPVDCADLACWDATEIPAGDVFSPVPLKVMCDFKTAGGGWTIMQKRRDPHVDFYRTWAEYKKGFGRGDTFWLGLEHIYRMTKDRQTILRIEVGYENHTFYVERHIEYEDFSVGSESTRYRLHLGKERPNSTLPDSLREHVEGRFCVKDSPDCKMARDYFETGWWYVGTEPTYGVDLNGKMVSRVLHIRIAWKDVEGYFTMTSMKIRPKSFKAKGRVSCDRTCPNGGTCRRTPDRRFKCDCDPDFTGPQCRVWKSHQRSG